MRAPGTATAIGVAIAAALGACGGADAGPTDATLDAPIDGGALDAAACPADMLEVGATCMDRYEAPNRAGALPLVMYTFVEAEAWCAARDRRLCFDDEWLAACAGPDGLAYPYGATRVPGTCNDDATWRAYTQSLLNGWPAAASSPTIDSLDALFAAARAVSPTAAAAADHVAALYQGSGGGARAGCVGPAGVYDLVGDVEEWTRRRDGGQPQFHGNLKGRYWAEARTCQSSVLVHGDTFRFYEIGFRCCRDRPAARQNAMP